MIPDGHAGGAPETVRPQRGLRPYLRDQTPLSAATAAIGAASLALLLAGTLAVVSAHGWIGYERIVEAIESGAQGLVLYGSLALGALAVAVGWSTHRRMVTKPSREAAVAGAVLGVQAALLAALFLWFRGGEVERFARNFFQFEIVAEFWTRFVRGAVNTLILALAGEAIGIALGLVLAIFALSSRAVVRAPARVYINVFRGTPLLWQLQFGFFGIVLALRLRDVTAYQAAIFIIGLNAGAYSAEVFRAGVQSIERAQFEAARSLGMSYFQALRYVILPQAFRRVIPPLTNEFVILIKDTSLVSILGLTLDQQELMAVGADRARTFANATPFIGTAAGYLAITLPMIRLVTWLEGRLRSGLRVVGAGA